MKKILILIFSIVTLLILLPFLCFVGGWIDGWLIQKIFGETIVKGLSLIGIHVIPEQLPLLFGTIAVIASFFQNYGANRHEDYK